VLAECASSPRSCRSYSADGYAAELSIAVFLIQLFFAEGQTDVAAALPFHE
jgi:hypothetical protein